MSDNSTTQLSAGVIRTDLPMADGRTIRYYDQGSVSRTAADKRPIEAQPGIGELRFDPMVSEWVAVASHRQGRVFLPPKELCPLCPTRDDLLSEIPDSSYQVVVFDNRSPSFTAPSADWELTAHPDIFSADIPAAGKCEVVCYTDHHEGSFGALPLAQIRMVMEAWRDRTREISKLPYISYVFPFENRGEEVGAQSSLRKILRLENEPEMDDFGLFSTVISLRAALIFCRTILRNASLESEHLQ